MSLSCVTVQERDDALADGPHRAVAPRRKRRGSALGAVVDQRDGVGAARRCRGAERRSEHRLDKGCEEFAGHGVTKTGVAEQG